MDKLAVVAAAHAPPEPARAPRRDIDVILASYALRAQGVQGHGVAAAAAPESRRLGREVEEQTERLADAGLIQFTALPEPRTTAAARPWRCRVCQVECGGREGFREHCMSDEHYAGLQLFALHSDLFTDRPNM